MSEEKPKKQVVIRCSKGYLLSVDLDPSIRYLWTDDRDQGLRMKFADAQEHLRRIIKTNPEAMIVPVKGVDHD